MSLEQNFNNAVESVNKLPKQPSQGDLLELYGLFKQATVGPCNTSKPGLLDLKGKAKWEAWKSKKEMSQDEAKEKYIAKAQSLGA